VERLDADKDAIAQCLLKRLKPSQCEWYGEDDTVSIAKTSLMRQWAPGIQQMKPKIAELEAEDRRGA
jgi:hypothetical protein